MYYLMYDPKARQIISVRVPYGMDVDKLGKKLMSIVHRYGRRYQAGKITREEAVAKVTAGEEKLGIYRFQL